MGEEMIATSQLDGPHKLRILAREFVAERVGWAVMALVVVAGLLGLLGPGWFSYRKLSSPDGHSIAEYYLVEHRKSPTFLKLHLEPRPESAADHLRIVLSRAFIEQTSVESITPEPVSIELHPDGLVYSFAAEPERWSGNITYRFQCEHAGWLRYRVHPNGTSEIDISQLVLP